MTVAITRSANSTIDQLILLQGNWQQFKLIQQGCQNSPGVRVSYYQGEIAILMPGQLHETFSRVICSLLSLFLAMKDIAFVPAGSMTQEKEGVVSAQADESYCLGRAKPIPDLSIEGVFPSGGVSKLSRYQALGVPEAWFWQDGVLSLYHLREQGYEAIDRSELEGLGDLDLALFQRCILIGETDAGAAIRVFQQALQ